MKIMMNCSLILTNGRRVPGQLALHLQSLPFTRSAGDGVFSFTLGDPTLGNMTQTIPASAFSTDAVYLRVWFDDGVNASQLLTPDRRVTSVAYALQFTTAASADAVTATKTQRRRDCSGPAVAARLIVPQLCRLVDLLFNRSFSGGAGDAPQPLFAGPVRHLKA